MSQEMKDLFNYDDKVQNCSNEILKEPLQKESLFSDEANLSVFQEDSIANGLKKNELEIPEVSFEDFVIDKMHHDDEMSLEEKCFFTMFLLVNVKKLEDFPDFMEEECHLGMLNWIWKAKKSLKFPMMNIEKTNILIGLLSNILNIFQNLHLKSNDILDLKLYEKLIKIKIYLKNIFSNNDIKNIFMCYSYILYQIQNVLNQWKEVVDINSENMIKLNQHLGKKTTRKFLEDDKDTEADSIDINSFNNKSNKSLIKINKKKLNVSFNFSQNKIIPYYKNSIPSEKIINLSEDE